MGAWPLGSEAQLVLSRSNKRRDHGILSGRVAQGRAVHLAQPEQDPADVSIAPQITKVLRYHECSIVLRVDKRAVVDAAIATLQVVIGKPVEHCSATAQGDQRRTLRR